MNAHNLLFTPAAPDKSADILAAARALSPHLGRGRVLDRKLVAGVMTTCFNGTDAEGAWSWRDAYDAIEAALVLQIRRLGPQIGRLEDAPAEVSALLAGLTAQTLTHTKRSEDQVALDQFSTPPALGALACAAAQVRPGDLVLEPSAGIGLLAALIEACGAKLHLNEISDHRAALLDGLFPLAARTRCDGAHIHDLAPASGSFHAAIVNPPFQALEIHLVAALKALAQGGRLSAIVPLSAVENGLLAHLARLGEVVAAIIVPGRAFAKHGTSVETALVVVDRTEPMAAAPALTEVEDLAAFAAAVAAIKPRPTAQPRTFRQVSVAAMLSPKDRGAAAPSGRLAFLSSGAPVAYETADWAGEGHDVGLYQAYRVGRVRLAQSHPHPSDLVESGPMASVSLPAPAYRPTLPGAVCDKGLLSDPQMEVAIYAGEAHSRMLPGWWLPAEAGHELRLVAETAQGAFQLRQGFFLGDGTGCGKGRQAAAVIMDNMLQGRTKAVWLSKNDPLVEDARRDWRSIGGSASDIVPQSTWKQADAIRMDKGVLFSTYGTLRQPARQGRPSRLDQIVAWLGSDFDGVIVFDESHAMANAIGAGDKGRGAAKPSLQGQAGLALQNRLPNARIVYVSATGATRPGNLAYAARLGLWGGPQAPFLTRDDFLKAVDEGGVAVMELIARELKAMGLYIARSLSFEGVEYEPLRHELTAEDVTIWDAWADAYQIIHRNLTRAMEAIGLAGDDGKAKTGPAKSAILSAFESTKLRFFAHLLAGLKAPTILGDIRTALAEGQSCVVQIVSTNEAVMERRLAEIPPEEWNNLSVDLTPKEYVLTYLQHGFPIVALQEVEDGEGNVTLVPLIGDDGPVVSQEAVEIRDQLICDLACLPAVPSVLDALLDQLGTDEVAEITGRSRRVVLRGGRRVVERRSSSAAKSETDAFMAGRKRVLVFSDAGGTGRSYHADLGCLNTQRRRHYLVEPGWRADSAIQGLGRSHRTNQACPPLFRPVTTDIQGEKRFISTISRRLDQLGALTKGDRKTAGAGIFDAADNLESPWAKQALGVFYSNLMWGSAECMTMADFEAKTGISFLDGNGELKGSDDLPPIHTFLNRVLALRIADQNAIFQDFEAILSNILERAARSGELDLGIEDIRAEDVTLTSEEVIRTDPVTGAQTKLVAFDIKTRREILSLEEAQERLGPAWGFYRNDNTGQAALVKKGVTVTDDEGRMMRGVRIVRPEGQEVLTVARFKETAWGKCEEPEWAEAWTQEVAAIDPWRVRQVAMVTGLLLPIWRNLPDEQTLVRRLKAPDGRRWLGRLLDPVQVPKLRMALGLTDIATVCGKAEDARRILLVDCAQIQLAKGLWLKRSLVMGKYRLEVVGGASFKAELKALGCFVEIISFSPRVFVGIEDKAALEAVLRRFPPMEIITPRKAA